MDLRSYVLDNPCVFSITACIFLTVAYVSSLYVWRSPYNRDHPTTIKRRFFSVTIMMIIAPFVTNLFLSDFSMSHADVYTHLGLRIDGLFQAIFCPLMLTAVLFLGPLTMNVLSGIWRLYTEPMYWVGSWCDLVWVRNHFIAPLSEEWVFRACMMPLLMQCLQPTVAVFVGPLLFGVAHFHHMLEQMKNGLDLKTALLISIFQFSYTSMFGAYSAYLFVRTGHFVAPLVAHVFCNHMGFPNVSDIGLHKPLHRLFIVVNFVMGFTLWCILLKPMTDPDLYQNKLHWLT